MARPGGLSATSRHTERAELASGDNLVVLSPDQLPYSVSTSMAPYTVEFSCAYAFAFPDTRMQARAFLVW